MRNRRFNALIGSLLAVCCISLMFAVVPLLPTAVPAPAPSGDSVLTASSQDDEGAAASSADAASDATSDDGQFHMDPMASYEEGYVLAELAPNTTPDQAVQAIATETGLEAASAEPVTDDLVKFALPEGVSVESAVNALTASSAIADAQPNYEYFIAEEALSGVASSSGDATGEGLIAGSSDVLNPQDSLDVHPNDSYYVYVEDGKDNDMQSNYLDAIRLSSKERNECGWSKVTDSASSPVVIAVLDEGFDLTHEDFDSSIFVGSYNAVKKNSDLSGFESHGTHVLSVLAANTNNGKGIAGVTYNKCKAMPIKVSNSQGKMYTDSLVEAYTYLIAEKKSGVNVRVVNMSLGNPRASAAFNDIDRQLYEKIREATGEGILSVAAACNADEEFPEVPFYAYPSDFDQVVSVIGLKAKGQRYDPSNYNMPDQHAKNICAPAQFLSSSTNTGIITLGASDAGEANYMQSYGTSMAAPMVSGVAALMFTTYPSMTPEQVTSKLYSSADDIQNTGEGWYRETGYGRLNALSAMSESTAYISGATVAFANVSETYSVYMGSTAATGFKFSLANESDSSIAEITEDGVLTPKAAGEVTILASKNRQCAYQTVTVYADSSSATIEGLDTVMAGTEDSYSVTADPRFSWIWQSSDSTIATIDRGTGLLRPRTFGLGADKTVIITAARVTDPNIRVSKTVTITSNDISVGNTHVTAIVSSATYNGRAQSPTVTVKYDNTVLKAGTDYTVTLPSETNAGTYTFKIEGKGSYTGERTLSFTINKASINSASIRLSATSFVYDGKAKAPSVAVYDIGNNASTALVNGTDYTVVTRPATLGNGSVVITAKDGCKNFTDQATRSFTVTAQRVSMYRLYNPYSGEHFYTASASERDYLRRVGWNYEGLGWTAPHTSSAPVYRMYNAYAGDHHYTLDASERDALVRVGWKYEGVGWYSDTQKTTPLYREYNPNAVAGSHNYTTSLSEHRFLCSVGWRNEGIGWYGL